MLQSLRNQTFRLLYFLGRTPPNSADVRAEVNRLDREFSRTINGERCDCLVFVGRTAPTCCPSVLEATCDNLGLTDGTSGWTGQRRELGHCRNME